MKKALSNSAATEDEVAARFLRQAFWCGFILVVGVVCFAGAALTDYWEPLRPAQRAFWRYLSEQCITAVFAVFLVGVVALGWLFLKGGPLVRQVRKDLIPPIRATRLWSGIMASMGPLFVVASNTTGPILMVGCLLFPIAFFIWLYQLSRVCRVVAADRGTAVHQERAKTALRNWWFVLAEMVGLTGIGVYLSYRSSDSTFIDLLTLIFIPLLLYSSIFLLVLLRSCANALVSKSA